MALFAGTSGFSYPNWRGGFYPVDAKPGELLRHYAQRLPAVELHGAFRRLPEPDQFRRWAEQTPPGFRFAVKMSLRIVAFGDLAFLPVFYERVRALGDRLGPILVQLPDGRARDDAALDALLAGLDPTLAHAVELKHESWQAPEVETAILAGGAVPVGLLRPGLSFAYLRLREPPYSDADLEGLAHKVRPLLAEDVDVYCFFRHEDDPRGALYALRLAASLA